MDAVAETIAWQGANPEAAADSFLESRPALDDALNRQALSDTAPLFASDPGRLDVPRYAAMADFKLESGLVLDLPPLATSAIATEATAAGN